MAVSGFRSGLGPPAARRSACRQSSAPTAQPASAPTATSLRKCPLESTRVRPHPAARTQATGAARGNSRARIAAPANATMAWLEGSPIAEVEKGRSAKDRNTHSPSWRRGRSRRSRILSTSAASPAAALLFVVLYGLGNGMLTIVKGTAIAQYVSREHVASLNGALGLPTAVARAVAPLLLGVLWSSEAGYRWGLAVLLAAALVSTLALWGAQRRALQAREFVPQQERHAGHAQQQP